MPLIADDFRVISLDLPGFGLTGAVPTNDYSTENFIQVVQELSQELELGKFLIAGNSTVVVSRGASLSIIQISCLA